MIEHMQLLPLLPATAAELIEQTGRSHESVYTELVHLEGQRLVEVRCQWLGKRVMFNEWHCKPDALCLASRDGFCEVTK